MKGLTFAQRNALRVLSNVPKRPCDLGYSPRTLNNLVKLGLAERSTDPDHPAGPKHSNRYWISDAKAQR